MTKTLKELLKIKARLEIIAHDPRFGEFHRGAIYSCTVVLEWLIDYLGAEDEEQ